jgi:hypothetical protein
LSTHPHIRAVTPYSNLHAHMGGKGYEGGPVAAALGRLGGPLERIASAAEMDGSWVWEFVRKV